MEDRSSPRYDTLLRVAAGRPWTSLAAYGFLLVALFLGMQVYFVASRSHETDYLSQIKNLETQSAALRKLEDDTQKRLRQQEDTTASLARRVAELEAACKKKGWCPKTAPK
jgi:hypothetical protein